MSGSRGFALSDGGSASGVLQVAAADVCVMLMYIVVFKSGQLYIYVCGRTDVHVHVHVRVLALVLGHVHRFVYLLLFNSKGRLLKRIAF